MTPTKFIPIVLTEEHAYAALAAVQSVFMTCNIIAQTDEERAKIKILAGTMVEIARAIDKAVSE